MRYRQTSRIGTVDVNRDTGASRERHFVSNRLCLSWLESRVLIHLHCPDPPRLTVLLLHSADDVVSWCRLALLANHLRNQIDSVSSNLSLQWVSQWFLGQNSENPMNKRFNATLVWCPTSLSLMQKQNVDNYQDSFNIDLNFDSFNVN